MRWLLTLPCSITKVNEIPWQPVTGRTTDDWEPSEMKDQATPPSKDLWPAEVLAEGKRKYGMSSGRRKTEIMTSYRNEDCKWG